MIPTNVSPHPPAGGVDGGACCVLVTGAPGSGKSTVTRGLGERLTRSALLNGDRVHGVVVGGRVWALGEPRDEAQRQVALGNANLAALASNCARARFTPIIDWVVPDITQLAQLAGGVAPLPVWLIVLDPGREACTARNLTRDDRFDFDGHDALLRGMRDAFGESAWWLDSSTQTPDETVQVILDAGRRAG